MKVQARVTDIKAYPSGQAVCTLTLEDSAVYGRITINGVADQDEQWFIGPEKDFEVGPKQLVSIDIEIVKQ